MTRGLCAVHINLFFTRNTKPNRMSVTTSMRAPASISDSLPDSAQTRSDNERAYNVLWTEWKKKAFVEFYLQLQSLYVYRRIHNSITYPMIILSTIAGATIFSSNNQAIQYVAATFSMLSALLTGMLRQIRPGEIATEHLSAMRRWSKVSQQIQQVELLNSMQDKNNVELIITKLQSEMDSITSSQPEPHVSAIRLIRERYGPDMMDKICFGQDIRELQEEADKALSTLKRKKVEKEESKWARIKDVFLPDMINNRTMSPFTFKRSATVVSDDADV